MATESPLPRAQLSRLTGNQLLIHEATTLRFQLINQMMMKTLDTNKDINGECGYPNVVTPQLCKLMWDREGIAKRVIAIFPEESWRGDPEVYEDEDPGVDTEFEKALNKLVRRFMLWNLLQRVDILSGIGTFGVILLGIDDGLDIGEPVDGCNEDGSFTAGTDVKLLYLRTFDESCIQIASFEGDQTNPRFGLPTAYNIQFIDQTVSSQQPSPPTKSVKVHWSRIIHVADNLETSEVYGIPRIQDVYNRLYDLRKVLSSSGEMFWKGGFPGFSFEVNPEVVNTADMDRTAMREEFEKYQAGLQRYLALVGVTAKSLATQVADPKPHVDTHLLAIAVSKGIPLRIFMGSEQAKLAASEDKVSWNERIRNRQTKYVTPRIIHAFVKRMIEIGILPVLANPENEAYDEDEVVLPHVDWPDLGAPSDKEKADVAAVVTTAMGQYISTGADALMPPEFFLQHVMGYSVEEVETIMDMLDEYLADKAEKADEDMQKQLDEASAAKGKGLAVPGHPQPLPPAKPAFGGGKNGKKPTKNESPSTLPKKRIRRVKGGYMVGNTGPFPTMGVARRVRR